MLIYRGIVCIITLMLVWMNFRRWVRWLATNIRTVGGMLVRGRVLTYVFICSSGLFSLVRIPFIEYRMTWDSEDAHQDYLNI